MRRCSRQTRRPLAANPRSSSASPCCRTSRSATSALHHSEGPATKLAASEQPDRAVGQRGTLPVTLTEQRWERDVVEDNDENPALSSQWRREHEHCIAHALRQLKTGAVRTHTPCRLHDCEQWGGCRSKAASSPSGDRSVSQRQLDPLHRHGRPRLTCRPWRCRRATSSGTTSGTTWVAMEAVAERGRCSAAASAPPWTCCSAAAPRRPSRPPRSRHGGWEGGGKGAKSAESEPLPSGVILIKHNGILFCALHLPNLVNQISNPWGLRRQVDASVVPSCKCLSAPCWSMLAVSRSADTTCNDFSIFYVTYGDTMCSGSSGNPILVMIGKLQLGFAICGPGAAGTTVASCRTSWTMRRWRRRQ